MMAERAVLLYNNLKSIQNNLKFNSLQMDIPEPYGASNGASKSNGAESNSKKQARIIAKQQK